MKTFATVILGFLIVSNLNAQNVQTELKDGIIDRDYKGFSILNSDDHIMTNTKEAVIFDSDYMTSIITYTDPSFPTLAVKNEVEDAIRHELIVDGYDYQKSGANMLVIYSIFSKDGEISGDFVEDNNENFETYEVGRGTLLISIIDRESGQTIWSGFNDGALATVTSLEENKIVRSVADILGRLSLENDM